VEKELETIIKITSVFQGARYKS